MLKPVFVELHSADNGKPISINVEHIVGYEGSYVVLSRGVHDDRLMVKESYYEIEKAIRTAVDNQFNWSTDHLFAIQWDHLKYMR